MRGIRTKKWYHFAIAGMLCGAGFHTYIAFRIIPALLAVFFVLLLIQHGTDIYKSIWKYLIIFVLCAGVTIAPLLYTFHTHPEFLTARTGDVSVFAQKDTPLTQTLAHTVTQSLTKYHLSGDNNWRHNYPPYPIIEPIVGIWFLCGFLFSIGIFVSFAVRRFRHGNRNRKLLTHGLLIAWFFAFLAPEFMTTEGLPHCLRAIGTLPVVYIFAAYMINFVAERMQKKSPLLSYGTTIFLCTMFVWIGFFNITKYHVHWAHEHEQAAAFNKDLTDIARHIRTLPETETIYVVAGGLERLPIQLLTTDIPNIRYFYENEADMIPTDTPFLLFLPYYNDTVITTVTQKVPADIIEAHTDLGTSFFIIKSH
ncbi:MAG: hypothetical protein CR954_00530 [Candidatus Moraniibacteriota bacterium]|nr:MAG: hypothetical protein CR954_00530 [Candidatus Moranbacteria bacterium]